MLSDYLKWRLVHSYMREKIYTNRLFYGLQYFPVRRVETASG